VTRLTYLPAALADLREIAFYIAEDNPDRAVSFVDALKRKAAETVERPASFAARDDLAPGLRVARYGRYLILFQVVTDGVEIVRVLHGARDLHGALDA
jgi:toxin ParE1/3/4